MNHNKPHMSILSDILDHNRQFVETRQYEAFSKPRREPKLAVLACMDARLTELLPKAMGLKNGEVKLIKNAGALVTHPWGSVMRSLLLATYELGVNEICVVAHHDCGVSRTSSERILANAEKRGISSDTINTLRAAGINLEGWLHGFDNVEDSVRHTVRQIRTHPLIPNDLPVHGLVINPNTGALDLIIDGYQALSEQP